MQTWLVKHAGDIAKLAAGGAIVWSLLAFLAFGLFGEQTAGLARNAIDYVAQKRGVCTIIPQAGHDISPVVQAGTWGVVTWRDVERLRPDCGAPELIGIISNGGGIFHQSELSISGTPLSVGEHDLKYLFFVPNEVEPGRATFRVIANFPETPGGPSFALSPELNFTIVENRTP